MSDARLTPEEEALLLSDWASDEASSATTDHTSASPSDSSDLARQLEAIVSFHRDLASRFEDALSSGLQRIVETRLIDAQMMTYSQFALSRANPTCFVVIQAAPLPASLALDIHPTILYPILDCLLGGGKRPCPLPDRPPTELEARLAGRVSQLLLNELHDKWERVLAVNLTVDRIESHAQRVRLVAPSELVVALAFETRVAEQSGVVTLCLPLRAIRKIVDKLLAGEPHTGDGTTARSGAAPGDTVELAVQVESPQVSATQLEQLRVGDLLLTHIGPDGLVEVTLDGKPAFLGRLGAIHGRRAVELLPLPDGE